MGPLQPQDQDPDRAAIGNLLTRISLANAIDDRQRCREFRAELSALQPKLRDYTRALATMAAVEDLTELEQS